MNFLEAVKELEKEDVEGIRSPNWCKTTYLKCNKGELYCFYEDGSKELWDINLSYLLREDWEVINELKPCAHCGNTNIVVEDSTQTKAFSLHNYVVWCCYCETSSPGSTRDKAISRWNTRVGE